MTHSVKGYSSSSAIVMNGQFVRYMTLILYVRFETMFYMPVLKRDENIAWKSESMYEKVETLCA